MADTIAFEIETNSRLQGFLALDAEQRKAILDAKKLEVQMKQAEAATAMYGQAAAAAHERVSRAANAATAAEEKLNRTYAQRTNLRHGAGTALTQGERRTLATAVADAGAGDFTPTAPVMAAQMTATRRTQLATAMRENRRRQQQQTAQERALAERTEMETLTVSNGREIDNTSYVMIRRRRERLALRQRILTQRADAEHAAWERDVAPGQLGNVAVDFAGRYQGRGNDDVGQRVRRQLARRIRRSPELDSHVTADEFEQMAGVREERFQARLDSLRQRAADREPYTRGTAAIAVAGRGERRGAGDTRVLTEARRRVSRNIQNTVELQGRVTDEEFDTLTEQMAGRMEARSEMWGRVAGGVMIAATAVAGGVAAVAADDTQRRTGALGRTMAAAGSRRELRQIAGSAAEYRGLLATGSEIGRRSGMTGDEANAAVFAGKSADLMDTGFVDTIVNARKINLDPATGLQAVQKVRSNFGAGAGTTSEILGKLLIAAGPSPANVSDISSGVGIVASSLASIGGTADEALASLGVLSGPNKSVESTAERIKSVSDQINKKRGRIVQDGPSLQGLALIRALPRFAKEGRLRGDDGKQTTLEDFLGEQNAVNAARDLVQHGGEIDAQVKQMRGPGVAGQLAERADQYDPTQSAIDIAQANTRAREVAEEERYTRDAAVATAVAEGHKAYLTTQGSGALRLYASGLIDTAERSGLGSATDANYAARELYAGNVHDDATRRAVFDNLLVGRSRGEVETYLKQAQGGIGRVLDRNTIRQSDGLLGHKVRDMTAEEAAVAVASARARLAEIDQDATGPQAAEGGLLTSMAGLLPRGLVGALGKGVAGAGDMGLQFGAATDAFVTASNLSPSDYRVAIFKSVAARKAREAAPAMLAANFIPGADSSKAGAFVAGKAGEIGDAADEEIYQTNLKLIDSAEADAQAAVKGATKGTAKYDRADARLKGIRGLKRQAKATGGRIDAMEAQGIVDQITGGNGDEKFKSDLLGNMSKIIDALNKLPGGPAQPSPPATDTTPKKFKPPALPARAGPAARGARTS